MFDSAKQGLSTRYEGGAMFRRQEPRSLADIDELVQRQQQLRLTLGLERAAEIERQPELFSDGEKFRISHAKARTHAALFTFASYVGGLGALNMFMPHLNGRKVVNQNKLLVVFGLVGYYLVSYQIFSPLAGFSPTMWNEYNYAKSIR